jgi:hypothetical protein
LGELMVARATARARQREGVSTDSLFSQFFSPKREEGQ